MHLRSVQQTTKKRLWVSSVHDFCTEFALLPLTITPIVNCIRRYVTHCISFVSDFTADAFGRKIAAVDTIHDQVYINLKDQYGRWAERKQTQLFIRGAPGVALAIVLFLQTVNVRVYGRWRRR